MRGSGDVLEPFDPFAPYRSPKAVTPDHPRFVKWEEAQPVFASIYDACARSLAMIDAAHGIPSPLQFRVWRRFDRCCH
jgi:hypothetical protein